MLHHCAACLGKILGSLPARPEESLRRAWRLLDENRKGHIDLEVRVGMSWAKQRVFLNIMRNMALVTGDIKGLCILFWAFATPPGDDIREHPTRPRDMRIPGSVTFHG